jgi:hypothetical protein
MAQTLRFSQLSPARQSLVRICQALNFGQIRGVRLRDGDPILESTCVLADERLDIPEDVRPEMRSDDFVLCKEWRRLLDRLDEIQDGMIERIEVRAAVPRRVVFQSWLTKAPLTEGPQ